MNFDVYIYITEYGFNLRALDKLIRDDSNKYDGLSAFLNADKRRIKKYFKYMEV